MILLCFKNLSSLEHIEVTATEKIQTLKYYFCRKNSLLMLQRPVDKCSPVPQITIFYFLRIHKHKVKNYKHLFPIQNPCPNRTFLYLPTKQRKERCNRNERMFSQAISLYNFRCVSCSKLLCVYPDWLSFLLDIISYRPK